MPSRWSIGRPLGALLALLAVPALTHAAEGSAADPPAIVIDVSPAVVGAARALGPRMVFFTSRARPLRALADLRDPGREVGTADVGLAQKLEALLRAGGVKVGDDARELMRLVSASHFSAAFVENRELRLLAVRARPGGRQREVVERGGGVRLILRARQGGESVTVGDGVDDLGAEARPAAPLATSFGPLVSVTLARTARQRLFDAQEGARVELRRAAEGRVFVVLHIERDFGVGLGEAAYLYGSGLVLRPAFDRLELHDPARRRYGLAASHADGRTLELAYEVPAGARGLVLRDGDQQLPLDPLLAGAAPAQ